MTQTIIKNKQTLLDRYSLILYKQQEIELLISKVIDDETVMDQSKHYKYKAQRLEYQKKYYAKNKTAKSEYYKKRYQDKKESYRLHNEKAYNVYKQKDDIYCLMTQ